MTICSLDPGAFCSGLGIPGKSQRREEACAARRACIDDNADLLRPLAARYETCRHMAQPVDGRLGRSTAEPAVEAGYLQVYGNCLK